jgi:hypothetical protein
MGLIGNLVEDLSPLTKHFILKKGDKSMITFFSLKISNEKQSTFDPANQRSANEKGFGS